MARKVKKKIAKKKKPSDDQQAFLFDPDISDDTAAEQPGETDAASDAESTSKKTKSADKSASRRAKKEVLEDPIHEDQIEAQAEAMAKRQREISISEFFAKNRHLLGFDNPRKALLTTIKEAVDNSLDACEEAGILPELEVGIKATAEDRYRVWITDNGPGIVKKQIPNIFGRLLYGSKFHTLRMARGQQGIGISAAGMYGLLTTGKPVQIISKTGPKAQAHYYELRIDTTKNRPEIMKDEVIEWEQKSGTKVEIELEARYQKGRQSVDEYLAQTAITNPHARIRYVLPDDQVIEYERADNKLVRAPKPVKPHPYGVEIGVLLKMAKDTSAKTMTAFLTGEFSRVSDRVGQDILDKAKLSARKKPNSLNHHDAEKLHHAIKEIKIMAPSTNCVVPIGEEALRKGLEQVVQADFYDVCTRPPSVYRGNPFQIEVGLAYGGGGSSVNEFDEDDFEMDLKGGKNGNGQDEQKLMRVFRFANRVPLLYQQSACAIFKSIMATNWRNYGLSQSKGALPSGPVTVIVHIASVWVPFTSESKEAVAHYPEIIKEVRLALADCGRRLGRYLRGQKRAREEALKRSYIEKYQPAIVEALRDILSLSDKQISKLEVDLPIVIDKSRKPVVKS